ncbi:hypothetical protein ABRZ24_12030 [Brenneria populi]|uniref:Uncharacterized protein n=1 Tax=Brenneria populi TaxID=1505588 RepID=A0ABU6JRD5_9GAMM|nr:hypothetical protein [Brenneria populi Li et al. 2015]
MRNIGLSGGDLLVELGTRNDFVLFFECIKGVTAWKFPDRDWSLLLDRLYRRYLCQKDISVAREQMEHIRKIFATLPSASIQWDSDMMDDPERSKLNINKPRLSDVFSRYFDAFIECAESAEINYSMFKSHPGYEYEAVKIVISDLPWFIEDKNRPLEQYDALGPNDPPFWLR